MIYWGGWMGLRCRRRAERAIGHGGCRNGNGLHQGQLREYKRHCCQAHVMLREIKLHGGMQPVAMLVNGGNSRTVGVNISANRLVYRILMARKVMQIFPGRQVDTEDAQEQKDAYLLQTLFHCTG